MMYLDPREPSHASLYPAQALLFLTSFPFYKNVSASLEILSFSFWWPSKHRAEQCVCIDGKYSLYIAKSNCMSTEQSY